MDLPLKTKNPVMLTNIIYDGGTQGLPDDWISLVYKDLATGEKFVTTIDNPTIEVGILKPAYRDKLTFNKNYIDKNKVDMIEVHYKSRNVEIGNMLGIDSRDVRANKYVFSSDIDIKAFYFMLFKKLYDNDLPKPLSLGFIDIESDVIEFEGFAPIGEPPIYAVTYIDDNTKTVYGLFYSYEKCESSMDFYNNHERFEKHLHEKFDEDFPEYKFKMFYYLNEIEMIVSLAKLIMICDNDYIGAWNMPYDVESLIKRIEFLGYDPASVFYDDEFGHAKAFIRPDTNPVAHKRKHLTEITIKPAFVDMLVLYAGVRSAGKKLHLKLSAVCQNEINDDKLDYSEVANIKTLPYVDFELACVYNIKDVLLLARLNQKTDDFGEMYMRMTVDCLMPNQIFTSTEMLTNSIRMFFEEKYNLILGNNIRKAIQNAENQTVSVISENGDDLNDMYANYNIQNTSEEEADDEKQFSGAFVANTTRMSPTSTKILGKAMKYIHDYVIDFDIRAEYPSAIMIMNNSNESLVGKVMLNEKVDPIPMYGLNLQKEEKDDYVLDPSEYLTELIAEDAITEIGSLYCGLPRVEELIEMVRQDLIEGREGLNNGRKE